MTWQGQLKTIVADSINVLGLYMTKGHIYSCSWTRHINGVCWSSEHNLDRCSAAEPKSHIYKSFSYSLFVYIYKCNIIRTKIAPCGNLRINPHSIFITQTIHVIYCNHTIMMCFSNKYHGNMVTIWL